LVPAVATVLPNSRYQFCPAHYLRNLAEPLAEADAAFKGELRHTVRQHVGDMIRQEPRMAPGQAGVLTVTGLLPTPLEKPMAPAAQSPPLRGPLIALEAKADEVITHLVRHTRSLLTLKGRPPFRLAGLETYERLQNVAQCSLDLLAERYDPRLAQLYQGLQSALSPFAHTYQEFRQGAAWLRDIAYILEPCPTYPMSATQVAGQLRSYLGPMSHPPSMRLVCTSTRSAGTIGPVCFTAMMCRAYLGPTTHSKATSVRHVAACCGSRAKRASPSACCNAKARGNSSRAPPQRPSSSIL